MKHNAEGMEMREHLSGLGTRGGITRRRALGLGAGASAALVLASACQTTTPPQASPQAKKAVRGGTLQGGQVFDLVFNQGFPWQISPTTHYIISATTEPLVRYRGGKLEPELVLADRFEYNADRTKLTATLRPGVTFHNGAPVTPEDVFFGIDALVDPAKYGITGAIVMLAVFARAIREKKKVDARTMEFTFAKPFPNATDFFAQFQVTHAASYPKLLKGEDVQGTGPFKFAGWQPGQRYRLEANPSWHRKTQDSGPYLDAVDVRIFADQEAVGLAFESRQIEFAFQVNPSVAKRFKARGLTWETPIAGVQYVGVNTQVAAVQDKRVRQALFHALDRKRFRDEVGEGFGYATVQPWPKTSPAYDPELDKEYYDPEKAKSLLRAAGFSQSKPLELNYSAALGASIPTVAKANFQAVGVNVQLAPLETGPFSTKFRQRTLELWTSGSAFSNLTPLSMFQQAAPFVIPNPSNFERPEYKDIIQRLETLDPLSPQAKEQYGRFNRLWLDDPFLLPVGPNYWVNFAGEKVHGYEDYFILNLTAPYFDKLWKES